MTALLDRMDAAISKFTDGLSAESKQEAATVSDEIKGNRFDRVGPADDEIRRAKEILALDKNPVSEEFTAEVAQAEAGLSPVQKQFLKDHGVGIKAVRHISDLPKCETKLDHLGATRRNEGVVDINLAEKIWHKGKWDDNPDLTFSIRHEVGHAVNMLSKTDLISNQSWFVKTMSAEVRSLKDSALEQMGIDKELFLSDPAYAENIRDEVFSDLYAHLTPQLESNNPFSIKVKDACKNTLMKMQEHASEIPV